MRTISRAQWFLISLPMVRLVFLVKIGVIRGFNGLSSSERKPGLFDDLEAARAT